ncbi:MAG: ComF family protein [Candidatus Omnitrophota bacterium]|nr:ComF family protein [Candidatus Omnitrophota bacterium]
MTRPITIIAKNFANLLYPLHCAACKESLEALNKTGLCLHCDSQIKRNPKPYCSLCGRSLKSDGRLCAECERGGFAFDRAWSACLYEGVLKELIHLFKYRGRLSLSGILCGKVIDFIKDNTEIIDGINIITFVPLYNAWLNQREYNQSGILAAAISREFGVGISKALEKKHKTRRQNELSKEERSSNLLGLFRVKDSSEFAGTRALLIDDVMTTGATLNECAKCLKSAGAAEVRCLTLARGV